MKIANMSMDITCGKCGETAKHIKPAETPANHVHTMYFDCSNPKCTTKFFLHIQEVKSHDA